MELGISFLDTHYGLKAVHLDTIFEQKAYFAGDDERRMNELVHWLTSSEVSAIIAVRGGYGCARFYPELASRLKKIRHLKPKIILGYSDLTIILNGLLQDFGWTTFHGPVLVGRPFREPLEVEERSFRKSLFSTEPLGSIVSPEMQVIEPGNARGPIVGGCLSLVVSALGTSYEVDTRGKILFLEDVDERPYRLDRMLTQLLDSGSLDKVRGIVFGQMHLCDPAPESRDPNKTSALEAIKLAIGPFLKKKKIPCVFNFPAGHGSPQLTFPLGVKVEIRANSKKPEVVFLESGVKAK